MNRIKRFFPAHLQFLIYIWLVLVGIFMFCRYAAAFYIRPDLVASPYFLRTMLVGARFDIQVACYALLVPFFALFVAFLLNFQKKWLDRAIRIWCIVVVVLAVIITASDIPYFHFFNARLTTAAVQWSSNIGQQLRFLLVEWSYYPFYLVGGFAIYATVKWVARIWKKCHKNVGEREWNSQLKITALGIGLLFLWLGCFGFRRPALISMAEADHCPEGFLNQLSLNPAHTWFDSMRRFNINYIPISEAIRLVQQSLGVKKSTFESPIAREIFPKNDVFSTKNKQKPNVVLLLVESLSAFKMGIQGNQNHLTPRLDSLMRSPNSVFFDNFFSVGIHTSNGLFGSLFSYPVMISEHPMNSRSAQACYFTGLPVTLKSLGYQTSFFCTHGKDFDNIGEFFERNGFEYIVDKSFYKPEKYVGAWGIPDEILLNGAFSKLDSMSKSGEKKPIFSTILTISTHPPYLLPPYTKFKSNVSDEIDATFQYADWSLGNFFDSCATRDWYKNTIFLLCGDHGLNSRQSKTDVDMSYNHIPLLIHAPGFFQKNAVNASVGMQIDLFPTVMGMLGEPWVNNTLGIDLFREKRPFAYFSQDTKMGVVDKDFLYEIRKSGSTALYRWRENDGINVKADHPDLAKTMREYGCSMLQTSNFIIDRKLTGAE
jgi:phosphoglycerol transferase MdoB-like AlkP superfamily enzyme